MTVARRSAALPAAAVLGALWLAGCANRPPLTHAEAVDRDACRHRVDEVWDLQHRDERYRDDRYDTSTRDAPFASSGLLGDPTAGLSNGFMRDQMQSDCLSDRAGNVGTTPAAPPTEAQP